MSFFALKIEYRLSEILEKFCVVIQEVQEALVTPSEDPSTPSSKIPAHDSLNSSSWNLRRAISLPFHLLLKGSIIAISTIYRRLREMSVFANEPSITDQTNLPAFYALSDSAEARSGLPEMNIVTAAAVLGIVFGAIHCIGWSFIFPSKLEQKLWRICSMLITTIPAIALFVHPFGFVINYLESTFGVQDDSKMYDIMALLLGVPILLLLVPLPPVYFIARLTLLTEAVVALRDIPPEAYAQVVWASFLPHI